MKNLFNVDGDEIKRILSLHEESTKKQYLNLITEDAPQQTSSYTLASNVNLENVKDKKLPELKIFKGAVFQLENNRMIAKNATIQFVDTLTGEVVASPTIIFQDGVDESQFNKYTYKTNVTYDCQVQKLTTSKTGPVQYFSENTPLGKILLQKCKTKQSQGQQTDKKTYSTAKPHTFGGGKVTLPVGTKFIQAKNGASAKVNGVWGFYSCKNQSYFVKGSNVGFKEDDKTQSLGKKLNQEFCKGSSIDTGFKQQKVGGSSMGNTDAIVIPTDIDLSQITKELPAELQTVLTPPTVDGQPNTGGQPDFNQLLTQLQGLS